MGGSMVSSQESDIITFSHLLIQCIKEACQLFVQFQICLIGMLATGTPFMSDNISMGVTDTKHICLLALSQLLPLDCGDSHVCNQHTSQWRQADINTESLQFLVLSHLPIDILSPLGKFLHIVGTGDELSVFKVEPICGIRCMPCREDSGAVLIGHPDDF